MLSKLPAERTRWTCVQGIYRRVSRAEELGNGANASYGVTTLLEVTHANV